MSLADEVRTVREKVAARLRELEPLVHEYEELTKIAREIGLEEATIGEATPSPSDTRAARGSRRRRAASPTTREAGLPDAAGGELGGRLLEAIRAEPGQSVSGYAQMIGVPPTALYRPVRELTKAGVLVKRSRLLFPA